MERRIFLKLSSLLSAIGVLPASNVMASTNSAPMQLLTILTIIPTLTVCM